VGGGEEPLLSGVGEYTSCEHPPPFRSRFEGDHTFDRNEALGGYSPRNGHVVSLFLVAILVRGRCQRCRAWLRSPPRRV